MIVWSRRVLIVAVALASALSVAAQPRAPRRIVSTSPSITETLFALDLGASVVGVSTFCRYPEAVRTLPKVGTFLRPDAEVIARLRPDLVIVHPNPNDIVRQLSVLNIPAITVERGTLASVFSSIRAIGESVRQRERASALVQALLGRLGRIKAAVAARPRKRVLIIVGRRPGALTDLVAVGRGSYLSELVEIAGGENVLADASLPEFPRVSMETVIRLAPDVIIDAGDMGDTPEARERRGALALTLWKRQVAVSAVRLGAVYPAMSDAFVVPGPRVVDVAAQFAEWLHGVRLP